MLRAVLQPGVHGCHVPRRSPAWTSASCCSGRQQPRRLCHLSATLCRRCTLQRPCDFCGPVSLCRATRQCAYLWLQCAAEAPPVQPPARSGGRLGRTLDLLGWSQTPAGPPTSRHPLQVPPSLKATLALGATPSLRLCGCMAHGHGWHRRNLTYTLAFWLAFMAYLKEKALELVTACAPRCHTSRRWM